MGSVSFLRKCNFIYETLAKRASRAGRKRDPEVVLKRIEVAARFGSVFHSGRYADGRIENIAVDIGENLDEVLRQTRPGYPVFDVPEIKKTSPRHILHVATTVHDIGGHTRVIGNWIRNDAESQHTLLLISQGAVRVPKPVTDALERDDGRVIILPSNAPRLLKAKWLREVAQSEVDLVVLHHHPYDSVPILAFAGDRCCPVAIMNHADHVFWLGSSIADLVICIRPFAVRLSRERRFAKDTFLLPVPLSPTEAPLTRSEARARLGVLDDQVVLLSIGSEYKYQPTDTHDFLRTAIKILDENPSAELFLIGVPDNRSARYIRQNSHERLHLLGIVESPSDYQLAADVYLEGFPWNSWIALLETCLSGVCPLLMYAPSPQLAMSEDVALAGLVDNPSDQDEYVERATRLIRREGERVALANRVKENIAAHHTGDGWLAHLHSLYSRMDGMRHAPGTIPTAGHLQTDDDLNLAKVMQAQMKYMLWKAIKLSTFPSKRRKT